MMSFNLHPIPQSSGLDLNLAYMVVSYVHPNEYVPQGLYAAAAEDLILRETLQNTIGICFVNALYGKIDLKTARSLTDRLTVRDFPKMLEIRGRNLVFFNGGGNWNTSKQDTYLPECQNMGWLTFPADDKMRLFIRAKPTSSSSAFAFFYLANQDLEDSRSDAPKLFYVYERLSSYFAKGPEEGYFLAYGTAIHENAHVILEPAYENDKYSLISRIKFLISPGYNEVFKWVAQPFPPFTVPKRTETPNRKPVSESRTTTSGSLPSPIEPPKAAAEETPPVAPVPVPSPPISSNDALTAGPIKEQTLLSRFWAFLTSLWDALFQCMSDLCRF